MKYVTFSYDDNYFCNIKLIEILNEYGAKCTFNINSGMMLPGKITNHFLGPRKMISAPELISRIKDSGHEIACHGKGHKDLLKLTGSKAEKNIKEDKEYISRLYGDVCGFAYPFGSYSDGIRDILKSSGFCYARTTQSTHSFDVPGDFLEWNPTCHHNDPGLLSMAEEFLKISDGNGDDHIFYVWGHACEYGLNHTWNVLTDLLRILKQDKTLQFLTNREVYNKINK